MYQSIFQPAYFAVLTFFLFSVTGAVAQVLKLYSRFLKFKRGEIDITQICLGLHSTRELWSYVAFLLFALSAVTRSYIDYYLFFSRLPVLILSSIIIWFLQFENKKVSRTFYFSIFGNLLCIALFLYVLNGNSLYDSIFSKIVDCLLLGISFFVFYGKFSQALKMFKTKESEAVSWLREFGLVLKDITGFWYASSVGSELIWVSLTHILSFVGSSSICIAKYFSNKNFYKN